MEITWQIQQYFIVIHEVGKPEGKNIPKCDHVMVLKLAKSENFCGHLIDFSLAECENGQEESWFLQLLPSFFSAPLSSPKTPQFFFFLD